jgi:GNAT superfamily N-acetyltransferase
LQKCSKNATLQVRTSVSAVSNASLSARLWQRMGWAAAPFGELTCAILLDRSLVDPLPEARTAVRVSLRHAVEADMDAVCDLYSGDSWLYLGEAPGQAGSHAAARALYIERLRRGEICFLALSDGAIAHVNWLCSSWGDALPGHPIRLRSGEVYTTDGLTTEEFRGKGLHAHVLRAMLEHASARGARHAYTLAKVDRIDAHKGLFHLGWRERGRVVYFLPRSRKLPWLLSCTGDLEPLFQRPATVEDG